MQGLQFGILGFKSFSENQLELLIIGLLQMHNH